VLVLGAWVQSGFLAENCPKLKDRDQDRSIFFAFFSDFQDLKKPSLYIGFLQPLHKVHATLSLCSKPDRYPNYHAKSNFILPFFSLTLTVLFALSMATNKLHAILRSKIAIVIMTLSSTDCYLDIEVEGDIRDGTWRMRSLYSVRLYVDNKEVAKSTNKPASSVLKWEWNIDHQM
jgi:hypothetical protein